MGTTGPYAGDFLVEKEGKGPQNDRDIKGSKWKDHPREKDRRNPEEERTSVYGAAFEGEDGRGMESSHPLGQRGS